MRAYDRKTSTRLRLVASLAAILGLSGCAGLATRNPVPNAHLAETATVPGLAAARFWGDETPKDIDASMHARLRTLPRLATSATREKGRPVVEYLALSGGGPDGAFGAGILSGWSKRGTRPRFEVVTGISAGAIIAPFAFLGPAYDRKLQEIWTQYGTNDLVVAQVLPGLLGGTALADTAPLAELIAKYVDRRMLAEIAAEYAKGRLLLVGTTNLDAQRPVIWNMGEIAASRHPGAIDLFRKVILASASIPGAFPPVEIKVEADGKTREEMHVDGGVTRKVFITPAPINLKLFDRYYDRPPIRRIYILENGKIGPEFKATKPTTVSIALRSIELLLKSQNQSEIYKIYRIAQDSGAAFRMTSIPPSFNQTPTQAFDPIYQKALFELGHRMALETDPWRNTPPQLTRGPLN